MRIGRYFILLWLLSLSHIVYAQDNEVALGSENSLLLIVIALLILIFIVLMFRKEKPNEVVPEMLAAPQLEDSTDIMPLVNSPPIMFETTEFRSLIDRDLEDDRPYLVLTVRQAKPNSLTIGKQVIITPDDMPYIIGSRDTSNWRIVDSYVSGEHLYIDFDEATSQYTLVDRNSANGTRWNGKPMVKRRPYEMPTRHDVTLAIAVDYIFTMYVDEYVPLPDYNNMPFQEKKEIEVDLPEQALLPSEVIAHLNWQSPEINVEQNMQITDVVTSIGRGDDETIHAQIKQDLISKLHAHLVWKDQQFWLLDRSTNGTWLTTGSQGRVPLERGVFVPLAADTSFVIEVAYEVVKLKFRYTVIDEEIPPVVPMPMPAPPTTIPSDEITDKLPELPVGIRPLLHIVRDGDNEKRRDIRISTRIITIGRSEKNMVSIDRESIDEDHAQILWDTNQFWLQDLLGQGMTVNKKKMQGQKMALDYETIYKIQINEGSVDEVMLAFYCNAPFGEGSEKGQKSADEIDHTQKIDVNLS